MSSFLFLLGLALVFFVGVLAIVILIDPLVAWYEDRVERFLARRPRTKPRQRNEDPRDCNLSDEPQP